MLEKAVHAGPRIHRVQGSPSLCLESQRGKLLEELSPLQAAAGDVWGRSHLHHISHSHFQWAQREEWASEHQGFVTGLSTVVPAWGICYKGRLLVQYK